MTFQYKLERKEKWKKKHKNTKRKRPKEEGWKDQNLNLYYYKLAIDLQSSFDP